MIGQHADARGGTSERIALFLAKLAGGGAERVMLNLAQLFVEKGHEVDLVVAISGGELWDQVPPGVNRIGLDRSRALEAIPALAMYLRRRRPSALLSTIDYVNVAAIWARYLSLTRTRVVVRVTAPLTSVAGNAVSSSLRYMPLIVRLFYPLAARVIAVSKGVAEDLAAVMPHTAKKISVIYNPLAIQTIRAQAEMPLQNPELAPVDRPFILGLGRLSREKDFSTLIKAFAQVRGQLPSHLIIFGEGPDRPTLESLIGELGLSASVTLPGFVVNPYSYLKRAALMVLPSLWEGAPNVLLEALACGCPVISTDGPGGAAELLDGGRCGQLVEVGDVEALANAMLVILQGGYHGPSTLEEWLRTFDHRTVADQYIHELTGNSGNAVS
jgi:glycosyltransferase involved in cell wall biosynthesis